MKKNVIFLDLDNTIYPVSSIGEKLFKQLFSTIEKSGEFEGDFGEIKLEIQRTPFQKVARHYSFSKQLLADCMNIHINLTYDKPMFFFEDYAEIQKLPQKKYLVTSGFRKLQNSKIKQLGIEADFEEIHIIDLQISSFSKKDIFQKIMDENNYREEEVLVVGDDILSEIKAGQDLGIDTLLYDRDGTYKDIDNIQSISNFTKLKAFL